MNIMINDSSLLWYCITAAQMGYFIDLAANQENPRLKCNPSVEYIRVTWLKSPTICFHSISFLFLPLYHFLILIVSRTTILIANTDSSSGKLIWVLCIQLAAVVWVLRMDRWKPPPPLYQEIVKVLPRDGLARMNLWASIQRRWQDNSMKQIFKTYDLTMPLLTSCCQSFCAFCCWYSCALITIVNSSIRKKSSNARTGESRLSKTPTEASW